MSSSVTDATATLVTPNENRTEHSIAVTCSIHSDSTADQCVVMAMADGQATLIGNEYGYVHSILHVHTYVHALCIVYLTSMYVRMYIRMHTFMLHFRFPLI